MLRYRDAESGKAKSLISTYHEITSIFEKYVGVNSDPVHLQILPCGH